MREQNKHNSSIFDGILLAAVVFLCGIAVIGQTHSDFNKNFTFNEVKTWDFANERINARDKFGRNEIWDNYIRENLTAGFVKAGFTHSDERPGLIVRYRLGTKEKHNVTAIHDNWGGYGDWGYRHHRGGWAYWRGGGGWGTTTVFRTPYDQSTLVLDIVDGRTRELIWRGYDRRTVDDKSEKSLKKSVDKLMERFAKDVRKSRKS